MVAQDFGRNRTSTGSEIARRRSVYRQPRIDPVCRIIFYWKPIRLSFQQFSVLEGLENGLGARCRRRPVARLVKTAVLLQPALAELERQPAQGEVVHNDDTSCACCRWIGMWIFPRSAYCLF